MILGMPYMSSLACVLLLDMAVQDRVRLKTQPFLISKSGKEY